MYVFPARTLRSEAGLTALGACKRVLIYSPGGNASLGSPYIEV